MLFLHVSLWRCQILELLDSCELPCVCAEIWTQVSGRELVLLGTELFISMEMVEQWHLPTVGCYWYMGNIEVRVSRLCAKHSSIYLVILHVVFGDFCDKYAVSLLCWKDWSIMMKFSVYNYLEFILTIPYLWSRHSPDLVLVIAVYEKGIADCVKVNISREFLPKVDKTILVAAFFHDLSKC